VVTVFALLALSGVAQAEETYELLKGEEGGPVTTSTKLRAIIEVKEPECKFIMEGGHLVKNDEPSLVINTNALREPSRCYMESAADNTRFSKITIGYFLGVLITFHGYSGYGYPKIEVGGCVYKVEIMTGPLAVPGFVESTELVGEGKINKASEESEKGCSKTQSFSAKAELHEEETGYVEGQLLYIT
jgi:hypothetical protein